ncbi:MAG: dienelactone hydrolase family protein [Myxococcota bacterium]
MLARILYGLAALSLIAAWIAIGLGTRTVRRHDVEIDGSIPTVVYEPRHSTNPQLDPAGRSRWPVVVLVHDFARGAGILADEARRLADAGYAVVAPDLRGHGANRLPFPHGDPVVSDVLLDDLDRVVLYARTRSPFDAGRIALAGHGLGGELALAYAGRDPAVAAVIAVGGAISPPGPYPVPNLLLIWSSGDADARRARFRAIGAEVAELERLVLGRTYGEVARGTAVHLSEVAAPLPGGFGLAYTRTCTDAMLAWLALTIGDGARPTPSRARGSLLGWSVLGMLASFALLWGLLGLRAPTEAAALPPRLGPPWPALAGFAAALLGALPLVFASGPGLLAFVPLRGLRGVLAWLGVCGAALCGVLLARRRLAAPTRPELRDLGLGALLFSAAYTGIGSAAIPFARLWPSAAQLVGCAATVLLLLPYLVALETLLRAPGRGWAPLAGKGLTLLVLWASTRFGVVLSRPPGVIPVLLPALLLLEPLAQRLACRTRGPWASAVLQALWLGWLLGTLYPFDG